MGGQTQTVSHRGRDDRHRLAFVGPSCPDETCHVAAAGCFAVSSACRGARRGRALVEDAPQGSSAARVTGPRRAAQRTRSLLVLCVVAATLTSWPARALDVTHVGVRVIHAHKQGRVVDPKLRDLVGSFQQLPYTAYRLRDEATLKLGLGSAAQMQLPNGEWLKLTARAMTKDGKLRLDVAIEKLRFKTTVALAEGATLAVGGPPFDEGVLILALTRQRAKP